jgi:hypothetical protein
MRADHCRHVSYSVSKAVVGLGQREGRIMMPRHIGGDATLQEATGQREGLQMKTYRPRSVSSLLMRLRAILIEV